MATPLESRISLTLRQTWEATPKTPDADLWGTMARAAIAAALRTPKVTERTLPVQTFLVVQQPVRSEGFRLVAKSTSEALAVDVATAHLLEQGDGQAYIVEIKRVLDVA